MLCVSCSLPPTMALPHKRSPQRTPSTCSASPPSPSSTADSTSAMLARVRLSLSLNLLPPHKQPLSRLSSLLHPHQNTRRRLLWHRPPLRLAWPPPSQYAPLPHAVRRRRTSRVGRKASRRSKEDEKEVGGRLGRVQAPQGARGSFSPTFLSLPLNLPLSLSARSRSTRASYPSTIFFSSQIPRSSILFSRAWRAIYITSSKPEKVVLSLAASWLPSSNKSSPVSTTYMPRVIFTGT